MVVEPRIPRIYPWGVSISVPRLAENASGPVEEAGKDGIGDEHAFPGQAAAGITQGDESLFRQRFQVFSVVLPENLPVRKVYS